MSHPRVTIHPGQPKTGTSAIQGACATNRRLLAERWKILYPSLAGNFLLPYPHHQGFVFNQQGGELKSPEAVCDYFSKAFDYCAAHDLRHIVISWEAFFVHKWMDLLAESFDRLGVRPDFIFYLRRQDEWMESAWKQWDNKLPGNPDIAEYARIARRDWHEVMVDWSKRFPKESFRVRPYEKQQLQGGLISDFFITLGYDATLSSELAPTPESNLTRNSGFSPDVLSMLTLLRELNTDRHDHRLFDLLADLLGEQYKKREFESYRLLSPQDRIRVLESCQESNERVAREFMGREDGRLFLDPWPDPSEPWDPPKPLTLERALPILVSMISTLRQRLPAPEQSLPLLRKRAEVQEKKSDEQDCSLAALEERAAAQEKTIRQLRKQLADQARTFEDLQERLIAQENLHIRRKVRQEARRQANDANENNLLPPAGAQAIDQSRLGRPGN